MAKKSIIARERKKQKTVERFWDKRSALKQAIGNANLSYEERFEAQLKLQKLPRNASPARVQKRCRLCGRPHAVYQKVGLCRIHFREALMNGNVPGGRKSSW